ncbi:hypothetical protein [Streptomyces sp. NPDC059616]|uniref:hypothetical protein n=1 Tax=Streptomyces sp. NPDC059616 TaxID=3346886 RepID=UPI0036796D57
MTAQTPAAPQLTNDEFDELIDRINAHHQATLIAISAGRPKPAPFVMPKEFEGVSNDYTDLPQDSIDAFASSREANASQANGPHLQHLGGLQERKDQRGFIRRADRQAEEREHREVHQGPERYS